MALALGTATFSATDTASFTWKDVFTGSPVVLGSTPTILAVAVTTTDGTVQAASLQNPPTTSGGTVSTVGTFSGTVTVLGSG